MSSRHLSTNALLAGVICLLVLFAYPIVLLVPGKFLYSSYICLFSTSTIACVSLLIILTKREMLSGFVKLYPLAGLSILAIILIESIHLLQINGYSAGLFYASIAFAVLPLAISLCSNSSKPLIIHFLSIVWIINILHCIWQIFIRNGECLGLPGNTNWNASLILATVPFPAYIAYEISKNRLKPFIQFIPSSLIVLISLYFVFLCNSRGAWLSLAIVLIITLSIYFPSLKNKLLARAIVYGAVILLAVAMFNGEKVANIIFKDVRFSLWHSTVSLFLEHPFAGVSLPSFESAYAPYRPIDYFIKEHHFAFRTLHPHNEFLYILAGFGILGAAAWLFLWLYPVFGLYRRFRDLDLKMRLIILSFSILILHSMFDLVLFQWPTNLIACILLGFIWNEFWPLEQSTDIQNRNDPVKYVLIPITAIFLAVQAVLFVMASLSTSNALRNSDISLYSQKNPSRALKFSQMASETDRVPASYFHCAVISTSFFRDPVMSLYFFRKMEDSVLPQIAHSNRHIAECLLALGRKEEALSYMRKDTTCFPISVISLCMQISLEKELGLTNNAEFSTLRLMNALKHMGLTEKHIPEILKNPYYENKFVELRELDNKK